MNNHVKNMIFSTRIGRALVAIIKMKKNKNMIEAQLKERLPYPPRKSDIRWC